MADTISEFDYEKLMEGRMSKLVRIAKGEFPDAKDSNFKILPGFLDDHQGQVMAFGFNGRGCYLEVMPGVTNTGGVIYLSKNENYSLDQRIIDAKRLADTYQNSGEGEFVIVQAD